MPKSYKDEILETLDEIEPPEPQRVSYGNQALRLLSKKSMTILG